MHGIEQPRLPLGATTAGAQQPDPRPAVEVVRSSGRRRTSSARVRDGRIVVRLPAHLSEVEAGRVTRGLLDRLDDRARAAAPVTPLPRRVPARPTRVPQGPRGDDRLVARADAMAARWLADAGVRAASVRWSHRMTTRWASITVPPGRIRVSHRLADAPLVVLDCLLVHELAHIVHRGHGPAFRALADRHPDRRAVDAWLARRTQDELRAALGLAPRTLDDA